ncbi:MAG: hypothetical protein KBG20_07640 [Caldilineaceae bacterium]|nr:hypothetical protein [Caldilineaceae bacterium]MBP8106934.1 hypothetical protein [Caldilineaceae bacterium]MBP8121854.1 hypothetical protein [Caldilineaceae bacterium]MBP9072154.1 hypothetical protein [Caldilineaceae bacterium]
MRLKSSDPMQITADATRQVNLTFLGILGLLLALALWLTLSAQPLQAQEQPQPGHPPSQTDFLAPLSNITQVSGGSSHTCALTSAGGVKCWGWNESGQIGDGTTKTERPTPVDVTGLGSGVTAIAAGGYFSCALTTTGGVKCWGMNSQGQLGDGTTTSRSAPVDVTGLTSGVTAIAAGGYHTCALTTGGGVKCWGENFQGQLGDNTTTPKTTPVDVTGLTSGVTAIAAGYFHTCALTSAGGVKCWGYNANGTLGDNTTTNRLTPTDVVGMSSGVAAIAAGYYHTCALITGGGVKCWGDNFGGQLGDGTTTDRLTPVDVIGMSSGVTAIDTGNFHTCTLTMAGGVKCWGYNSRGQVGDGTETRKSSPVDVTGLGSGVAAIGIDGDHACAVTTTGEVKCWGNNAYGQLGDNTGGAKLTPVDVMGLNSGAVTIEASGHNGYTCVLTTGGGVKCWGDGLLTPTDKVGLSNDLAAVAAGDAHTCILGNGGFVKCWGKNDHGQLGDGTTDYYKSNPVDVTGLSSGVLAIAAGDGSYTYDSSSPGTHTCALTAAGGVKCWGNNGSGQLGDGSTTDKNTPVDVTGLSSGITAIAVGGNHTCALTAAGGVKCWGNNWEGQLGDGTSSTRNTPVDVSGLGSGVTAISAGTWHTCALTIGGGVKCWGDISGGGLTPKDVVGLSSGVAAIDAGDSFTCAVTTGGGAKCWGANYFAQLGDGTKESKSTPTDVVGLSSGVAAIAAGVYHACALTTSGGAKCWGSAGDGQLGDGTAWRLTPVAVVVERVLDHLLFLPGLQR